MTIAKAGAADSRSHLSKAYWSTIITKVAGNSSMRWTKTNMTAISVSSDIKRVCTLNKVLVGVSPKLWSASSSNYFLYLNLILTTPKATEQYRSK